jgi:cyclophilin family peptidyl-prolyl cis-trans isomerase
MTRHRSLRGLAALLVIPALVACTGGGASAVPTIPPATPVPSVAEPSVGAVPSAEAPSDHPTSGIPEACPDAQPEPLPSGETRSVTITTPEGSFTLKIEADLSPIAAGNFVALAECGYYDGVVIHRIAPGFVIQGGDGQFGRSPDLFADLVGSGGPGYTIKDEPVTAEYLRGTLAMAKTQQPDSASSQFFIVLADQGPEFPKRYQIFGHVTEGMDIVDAISNLPNDGSQLSLAVEPIPMTDVSVATP